MLIVTGSVTARSSDAFERLLALSLEHVRRSRTEPGCIGHSVHVDCENSLRLFFFERWADRAALEAHFAVPGSIAFIREMSALTSATDGPTIFETA